MEDLVNFLKLKTYYKQEKINKFLKTKGQEIQKIKKQYTIGFGLCGITLGCFILSFILNIHLLMYLSLCTIIIAVILLEKTFKLENEISSEKNKIEKIAEFEFFNEIFLGLTRYGISLKGREELFLVFSKIIIDNETNNNFIPLEENCIDAPSTDELNNMFKI